MVNDREWAAVFMGLAVAEGMFEFAFAPKPRPIGANALVFAFGFIILMLIPFVAAKKPWALTAALVVGIVNLPFAAIGVAVSTDDIGFGKIGPAAAMPFVALFTFFVYRARKQDRAATAKPEG